MMAANYRHIGGAENRLGRHYSRFSAFWPPAAFAGQSLALRKIGDRKVESAKSGQRKSRPLISTLPSSVQLPPPDLPLGDALEAGFARIANSAARCRSETGLSIAFLRRWEFGNVGQTRAA